MITIRTFLIALALPHFNVYGESPFSFSACYDPVNCTLIPIIANGTTERKSVITILEVRDKGGTIKKLFQSELENPDRPMMSYCFNQGRHLITINNVYDEGLKNSVVIYDFVTNKRRSYQLKEFCSKADLAKFTPSKYWKGVSWCSGYDMYPVANSGIVFMIARKYEGKEESDGLSLKINMIDQTIENLGWNAHAPLGVSEVVQSEISCFSPSFFIDSEFEAYNSKANPAPLPKYLRLNLTDKGIRSAELFGVGLLVRPEAPVFELNDAAEVYFTTESSPIVSNKNYWVPPTKLATRPPNDE